MDKGKKLIVCLIACCMASTAFAQLNLEDIFLKGKYAAKSYGPVAFLHQADRYAMLKSNPKGQQVMLYDFQAKSVDSLELYKFWTDSDLPQPRYTEVEISNTDAWFLLKANEEKMYRRSVAANYYITDNKGVIGQVGTGKYAFMTFSPDDQKLAAVKYNNLYWFDLQEGIEHPVTTDGEWNKIINGKSDWVYEEEFSLTRAFDWSPQSDRIAYLKFDESDVREFQLPQYYSQGYPTYFQYKYPKVGEANSKVSVWMYDLKKKKNVALIPDGYTYEYIPRIGWNAGGTEVWAVLLNRHQDTLRIVAIDANTRKTRLVYEEFSDSYVKLPIALAAMPDNSCIISSERDGYNHLYHYDASGKLIRQLTSENFEVTGFYGIDPQQQMIFFQSNEGQTAGRKVQCLNYGSLQMQTLAGDAGTNKAAFSPGHRYFIHTHSSASSPEKISLRSTTGSQQPIVLQDNTVLRQNTDSLPKKEFIRIPVSGEELEAWIMKPRDFDTGKKYPLFLFVYGGPGHQEVLDKWSSTGGLWHSYLTQLGYVVACVDNRGSGGRGAKFERTLFMNLGQQEVADQLAAARYFGALPYIDSARIGIYGASYGGYLAALCLEKGDGVFKAAVAQSPVSDWRFYDNIYTERYMRTPAENPKGYEQSSLLNDAGQLKGNLLLVHGISDDNVHFQHTIEFLRALNEAHIDYELYIYPDKNHGITGGETRYDLFRRITGFLHEKL